MHPTLGCTACGETCIFQWLPSAHTDTCKKSKLKELIVRHAWKSTLIKAREKVVPWPGTFPGLLLWRNSSSREVPQKQFDYFFYIDFCSILCVRTCSVGLSSGSIYFKALWIFTSTRHWLFAMLCAQCNPNLLPLACCLAAPSENTVCQTNQGTKTPQTPTPFWLKTPWSSPSFSRRRCKVARKKAETLVPEQLWEGRYLAFGSFWCLCYSSARPKPSPNPAPKADKGPRIDVRTCPTNAGPHTPNHFC